MMQDLASRSCKPCEGGLPPLRGDELKEFVEELGGDWEVVSEHHLLKSYKFKNFAEALSFVNSVGALAENAGHHPDIKFGWGYCKLVIYTHAIDGLSESDFILAAKIDRI